LSSRNQAESSAQSEIFLIIASHSLEDGEFGTGRKSRDQWLALSTGWPDLDDTKDMQGGMVGGELWRMRRLIDGHLKSDRNHVQQRVDDMDQLVKALSYSRGDGVLISRVRDVFAGVPDGDRRAHAALDQLLEEKCVVSAKPPKHETRYKLASNEA
jgi:hypothetical protein